MIIINKLVTIFGTQKRVMQFNFLVKIISAEGCVIANTLQSYIFALGTKCKHILNILQPIILLLRCQQVYVQICRVEFADRVNNKTYIYAPAD